MSFFFKRCMILLYCNSGKSRCPLLRRAFGISIKRNRSGPPGISCQVHFLGELEDAGICGTRLFGARNAKNKGTQYFYFSRSPMDLQQRCEMRLRRPPKAIFFKYSPQHVPVIYSCWQTEFILEDTNPDVDHRMEEFYRTLHRQGERRNI